MKIAVIVFCLVLAGFAAWYTIKSVAGQIKGNKGGCSCCSGCPSQGICGGKSKDKDE